MEHILEKLVGGDLRSIGRANEVVDDVLNNPALFDPLFNGMLNNDPVIRMRSCDTVEKITQKHPEYLMPYKIALLGQVAEIKQQEVRWHVAQMIPRLILDGEERKQAAEILFGYLKDESKIVQTSALQALADLAERDEIFLPPVMEVVEKLTRTGSPAVKNRARKLKVKLESI